MLKKMGRRNSKYSREDFLKEIKIYKQLLKVDDPDFEILMTGFVYLKEENVLDFNKLKKILKKEVINTNQKQTNKNVPTFYFEAGKKCLRKFGLNYKDINDFYLYKEVESIFYKKDFLQKIKDENWKSFYENKFYIFKKSIDMTKEIENGFIKKEYTIKDFFNYYKLSYNLIKELENKNPKLLKIALTGFSYWEEQDKKFIDFNYLKKELKKESIKFDEDFEYPKISKEILKKGKECLEIFGLDFDDINYFYSLEKLRENSFKRFLKKEIKDENWIEYFLDKNTK
jgi:hypothetical protein